MFDYCYYNICSVLKCKRYTSLFDTITLYIIINNNYIVVCNYTHIILERREKKCPTRTHLSVCFVAAA